MSWRVTASGRKYHPSMLPIAETDEETMLHESLKVAGQGSVGVSNADHDRRKRKFRSELARV